MALNESLSNQLKRWEDVSSCPGRKADSDFYSVQAWPVAWPAEEWQPENIEKQLMAGGWHLVSAMQLTL